MDTVAPGTEVFVPGLGFRAAAGALTLARPAQMEREGATLWLGRCVSAGGRTDLDCAFSGVEMPEEDPLDVAGCVVPWWRGFSLELRDAAGVVYPSARFYGGGKGARRSLSASFGALAPATREADLYIDGPLGCWRLPFELVSLEGVPVARALDVSSTDMGVTIAATALASDPEYTALRIVATAAPPARRCDGLAGALGSGPNEPRLALSSGQLRDLRGQLEALRLQSGALEETLVFQPLPPDPGEILLRLDRVLVEEEAEPCPITFPPAVGEYRLGRFSFRVTSAKPGETHRHEPSVAVALDVRSVEGRCLSSLSVDVDGASALAGLSWSAEGFGLLIRHPGHEPFTMTLRYPIVEVRGLWELPFRA